MNQITLGQRYQIEAFRKSGVKVEQIAEYINKNQSSIYRELKRNSQKRGGYNAQYAQMLHEERQERFRRARKFTEPIETRIDKFITEEQWSPKQIVGHCKKFNISMVSHERIYQYIRKDKAQGGNLYKELRHQLKHRKRPVGGQKKITIKNRVSIDERPNKINNKERFGDWEIDTIIGKDRKGAIVTIVERKTAFFMMKKLVNGKKAIDLAKTVVEMLLPYKDQIHSITSDNGTEFAEHEFIADKLELDFYFAHPYSSWERGLSEYTNKLIRQYVPKKTSFKTYSEEYLTDIQHKINRRPRENLNFENPRDVFYKLAS